MRQLKLIFVVVSLLATAQIAYAQVMRTIVNGAFRSTSTPELNLKIDDRFTYLGNIRFVLKGVADVDRHHWVVADDGEVTAMIILQFEGLREGEEGKYQFSIPTGNRAAGSNFRYSPEPIRLGDQGYVHNTWAYNNSNGIRNNPEAEAARTDKLLKQRGYRLADELIMSRFVRAVGEDQRNELIIFYLEPLDQHGFSLADFPDGEAIGKSFDDLSDLVTSRSLTAIEILEQSE